MRHSHSLINVIRRTGLLTLCCLCGTFAVADEPIVPEMVSDLVSQLNAPTRGEREAAERELIELGLEVLPLLPESTRDPAIAAALSRIRKQLHKQRATNQTTQPTLVSIAGTGPLGEVAVDWLDETGAPHISLTSNQRQRPATLKVNAVPYWRAIDRIAAAANLWPDQWSRTSGLTFRQRTDKDRQIQLDYPGVFRVAAGPIEVKPLPGETNERLYRLLIELRAEPKVRPLFIMHQASSGSLIGADGTRIEPFTPKAAYELQMGDRGGAASLRLDFKGPPLEGPFTFKGEFVATLASRELPFAFGISRGSFRPAKEEQGEVTVRLRDVTWNDDASVEVAVAVVYANGAAFESYRTWVYHNDAALMVERRDGEDRTLIRIDHKPGFDTVAQTPGALLLRYTFLNVPPDAENIRFEYRAPTDVIEVPLEVELEGLVVE